MRKRVILRGVLSGIFFCAVLGGIGEAAAFEFATHGYYRLRFEYDHDLDTQTTNDALSQGTEGDNDRFGSIAYGQQRFRLDPIMKLNDNISIQGQFDILDNTLFGQGQVQQLSLLNPTVGTVTLPGGSGAFGVTGGGAGDPTVNGGGSIVVKRLWVDLYTPVGKFRMGRQPSHWGLGVIQNDGNSREGDFGDTNDGLTYLAKYDFKNAGTLNGGVMYTFTFENTVDPSLDGLESTVGSNSSDTHQAVLFAIYQQDEFELGAFGGMRWRLADQADTTTTAITLSDPDGDGCFTGSQQAAGQDGDTRLYIFDLYGKGLFGPHSLALEGAYIGGTVTTGVAIDAVQLTCAEQAAGLTNPVSNPIEMFPESDISVFMGALEFEGKYDFGGEALLQTGFAQGDSQPLSTKITQFGFRKDYDIALMMFDMPLGTSPAVQVGGRTVEGQKPMSSNQITNAAYMALGYKHKFDVSGFLPHTQDFKIGLKGITAWAPARNLDIDLEEITGQQNLPHYVNSSRWYGFEVDASIEATLFDYLKWSGQAGVFVPGGLYDIKTEDTSNFNANGIDSIDYDAAEMAFALKTTFFFEF